jgi:hypothetical protein
MSKFFIILKLVFYNFGLKQIPNPKLKLSRRSCVSLHESSRGRWPRLYLVTLCSIVAVATKILDVEYIKDISPYFQAMRFTNQKLMLYANIKIERPR